MSHASAHAAEAVDVHQEAHAHHHPAALGIPNQKLGTWLFIASESMFFAALITTYMVFRYRSVVGPHPDEVVNIPLTTVSTFILLMSSLTMALGVSAAHRGETRQVGKFLALTILGGLGFLGIQFYEWWHLAVDYGLTWRTNIFGSIFFILTGFHKAHVIFGMLWLAVIAISSFRGTLRKEHAVNVDVAGLYWHFVDVVWIVIFTLVFLLTEAGV
ncbi:MAG: heme-copper oxidase subunit III [Limnochordales bacterium]|nr:heme-copper oxidase subunit III [Limnochordales bacterium]